MEKTYTRASIIAATQKNEIARTEEKKSESEIRREREREINAHKHDNFIDMYDVVDPMDHY